MIGSSFWVRSQRHSFRRAVLHRHQRPQPAQTRRGPAETRLPSHLKMTCSTAGPNPRATNGSRPASPLPAATAASPELPLAAGTRGCPALPGPPHASSPPHRSRTSGTRHRSSQTKDSQTQLPRRSRNGKIVGQVSTKTFSAPTPARFPLGLAGCLTRSGFLHK